LESQEEGAVWCLTNTVAYVAISHQPNGDGGWEVAVGATAGVRVIALNPLPK